MKTLKNNSEIWKLTFARTIEISSSDHGFPGWPGSKGTDNPMESRVQIATRKSSLIFLKWILGSFQKLTKALQCESAFIQKLGWILESTIWSDYVTSLICTHAFFLINSKTSLFYSLQVFVIICLPSCLVYYASNIICRSCYKNDKKWWPKSYINT